jgi:beta-lactamase class A
MLDRRQALEARLDELAHGFSGKVALYVRDIGSGELITRDPDAVVPTASCIKLFVLMELMRRVAAGDFTLEQKIPVLAAQQVGGSGVLKELSAGIELPLRDVGTLMIVLSDNTATNMLVDLLGLKAINRMIHGLGLTRTTMFNKVDFNAIGDDVRGFAVSTAGEFGQALERVAAGTFVDRRACDTIIDIMERQQYLDLLPRYLPYNPYARELKAPQALRIANKTGFYMGVRCDAALLFLPGRTLVAVAFTRDSKDLTFNPDNENAIFLGCVGRAVHDYFANM